MQRGLGERAGGCQQGGLEGWLWQGGFECMVVVVNVFYVCVYVNSQYQ